MVFDIEHACFKFMWFCNTPIHSPYISFNYIWKFICVFICIHFSILWLHCCLLKWCISKINLHHQVYKTSISPNEVINYVVKISQLKWKLPPQHSASRHIIMCVILLLLLPVDCHVLYLFKLIILVAHAYVSINVYVIYMVGRK